MTKQSHLLRSPAGSVSQRSSPLAVRRSPRSIPRKDYCETRRRSPPKSSQSSTSAAPVLPPQLTISFEVILQTGGDNTRYVGSSVFDLPPELLMRTDVGLTQPTNQPVNHPPHSPPQTPPVEQPPSSPTVNPEQTSLPPPQPILVPTPFDGLIERMLARERKIAELETESAQLRAQQDTRPWEQGGPSREFASVGLNRSIKQEPLSPGNYAEPNLEDLFSTRNFATTPESGAPSP